MMIKVDRNLYILKGRQWSDDKKFSWRYDDYGEISKLI